MTYFYALFIVPATIATFYAGLGAANRVSRWRRARAARRAAAASLALVALCVLAGCNTGDNSEATIIGGGGTGGAVSTGAPACPQFPHAVVVHPYDGGPCQFTACEEGWANCDGQVENGCEVNITQPGNCGICGTVCSDTQACGIGCGKGWGCWTPGGDPDGGGPNDCPACFPLALDVMKCPDTGYAHPYACQTGATIGGCMASPSAPATICCP